MIRWLRPCWFLAVAIWLTASWHCGLEAAGLVPHGVACTATRDADASADHCGDNDGCRTVEDATYRSNPLVRSLAPGGQFLPALPVAWAGEPDAFTTWLPVADAGGDAADWIPQWRFVQRAAPQSRAPSAS